MVYTRSGSGAAFRGTTGLGVAGGGAGAGTGVDVGVDATTGGADVAVVGVGSEIVSAGSGGSGFVTTGLGLKAGVDAASVEAGGGARLGAGLLSTGGR